MEGEPDRRVMLASLINVPKSKIDWDRWSLSHRTSHDKIRQAIQARGVQLQDYQLDPINFQYPEVFLNNNQQTHNEMNAALGSQASDLLEVDLKDDKQLQAWVYLHYLEHQSAELALGI